MAQRSDGIGALPAANDVQRALLARETGNYVMTPAGPVPQQDPLLTEAQFAYLAGSFAPGAGALEASGAAPEYPTSDMSTIEMLRGPRSASLLQNLEEGNYGTATLQGLAALGDAAAIIPVVGPAAGAVLKAPRAVQKVARAGRAGEGIRAYHGSPHDFDRFDTSKIGSGEGAQAYGYGLYFAEREGIAKEYRRNLAGRKVFRGIDSKIDSDFDAQTIDEMLEAGEFSGEEEKLLRALQETDYLGYDRPYQALRDVFDPYALDNFDAADPAVDNLKKVRDNLGAMYEVRLKVEPENLLDWDAPLWEQSEPVKRKLADAGIYDYENGEKYRKLREEVLTNQEEMNQYVNAGKEVPESLLRRSEEISSELRQLEVGQNKRGSRFNITGQGAYYRLGQELSGRDALKQTSERLEALGIEGISYRDANSRGFMPDSQRTNNFVVFDPQVIEIAKRYGIALPLAGAILMGTMTPEEAMAAQAPKEMEEGGAVTQGIGALEASEDVERVLGAMEFNELPDRIQVAAEEVAEKTGLDKRMIAANMLVGDLEFASDVAPFFGPFYQSENIDPGVARLIPGNIPMETAQGRMKGFYTPEQMSDKELRQLQSRAQLYAFSPSVGSFPEVQMERDTVYAVGPDASPEVWAHEFRHRMLSKGPREPMSRPDRRISRYQSVPPSQEGDNRLLDILYSNRPETYVSRSADPYPQNALAAEAFLSGESPTGGPARSLLDSLVDAGMVNPNDLYPNFRDPTMFERMFGSEGPTRQDIKDRLREPENTARGRLAREKAKSNN